MAVEVSNPPSPCSKSRNKEDFDLVTAETRSWLFETPAAIDSWLISVMDPEGFGLFKDCVDAEMPHCLTASGVGLWLLKETIPLAKLPRYSSRALTKTIAYAQGFQEPDSGLFIDPYLDERLEGREDLKVRRTFRDAVTKYATMFLNQLGSKPRYPYTKTGGRGDPDGQAYIDYLKHGDWDQPWGTGSGAAGRTNELFEYLNLGNEEVIPSLTEGMEIILSHQNPDTGMWGRIDIPLEQQMSGAFKIMAGPFWNTGFNFPHTDRLADTLIKRWADGSFQDMDNILIPRNVAELCLICLEISDYRRVDLNAVLGAIVESFKDFQIPDGGFASTRKGTDPINWCGSRICRPSEKPRSNMNATQAFRFCTSLMAPYIEWAECPWPFPRGDWKTRLARRPYRIIRRDSGQVEVVKQNSSN